MWGFGLTGSGLKVGGSGLGVKGAGLEVWARVRVRGPGSG